MSIASRIAASLKRVKEAREIAEALRHDDALHKVAMQAVFVLEDCHESLVRIRDDKQARHTTQTDRPR